MITNSREEDFKAKQEDKTSDGKKASSSTTSWSRLKDPRIVRVSRAFGGKDRHSKVCTVRGLRDRRVRLSVPTAIQLYDLQERLGLNQPSKAVDWLLNTAKHEIDKLPPLQMPPGNFGESHQQILTSHEVGASQSEKEGHNINNTIIDWDNPLDLSRSNYWSSNATLRDIKSKEVARETTDDEECWRKRNEEGKQGDIEGHGAYISSENLFPRTNHHPSLVGLPNNSLPENSFLRWDPSNLSLSHLAPQTEDLHQFNVVPLSSTLSMTSGSQVLVYPHGTTQSYFPSNVTAAGEFDPKQINFQMLSSSSQNPPLSNSLAPSLYTINQATRPFHLSMAPQLFPSQNNTGSERNKHN